MTEDADAVLREIARYPDDVAIREVWAGLVLRRGDADRAAIVREQLARRARQASSPYHRAHLRPAETALLEAHPEWTEELASVGGRDASLSGGFIETIAIDAATLHARPGAVLDRAPIRRLRLSGDVGLVPRLVDDGALSHVVWLDLSGLRVDAPMIESLAALPHLRALGLARAGITDGLVETIWQTLPRLRVCDLDGNPCADLVTAELTYQEMSSYEWSRTDRALALEAKHGARAWVLPSSDPASDRVDLEQLLGQISSGW
jgi:hypothetical protein